MANKTHTLSLTPVLRTGSGCIHNFFDIIPVFCSNPNCSCKDVTLLFHEPDATFTKRLFRITLNYETWKLVSTKLYENDADYTKIIHEFVNDFSSNVNDEIKEGLLRRKNEIGKDRYLLRKDIDNSKYNLDKLVFFSEIYDDKIRPQLVFQNNKKLYFVHDYYCADPKCDCNQVLITFQIVKNHKALDEPFLRFNLDIESGQCKCEHRDENISGKSAQKMFNAFTDYIFEDLIEFTKERFSLIRKWGEAMYDKPILLSKTTDKIGRNSQCPCGSGKKYKKCCILK